MKTVIIDNYDSFTYNLRHKVDELGFTVDVFRNDAFDIDDIARYDKIILSPGPGIPKDAGLMPEIIRRYAAVKPILGVCVGHQAIGEAFGAGLINMSEVFHGVQTPVRLLGNDYIFEGLEREILVGRYHSWIVDTVGLPDELEITALSQEGFIMALRHKRYDVHGIQFHPESILTPQGKTIIANFLKA